MVNRDSFPIGFLMELSQYPDVLNHFSFLSEAEQNKVLDDARKIQSHDAMRHYVESCFRETAY